MISKTWLCSIGMRDWSPVSVTGGNEHFGFLFVSYVTQYGERICYRCKKKQKMYRDGFAGLEKVEPKWHKV